MNLFLMRFAPVFLVLAVSHLGVSARAEPSAAEANQLRQRLKHPSPSVRKQAALTLAEANDAEAVPVLIDLLAELPVAERQPVEDFLSKLAGEWAPVAQLNSDDRIARTILHDAWRVWWRHSDGPALLDVIGEHTLTPQMRLNVKALIAKLGDEDFVVREAADAELYHLGRRTLPLLRQALKHVDLEIAHRARLLVDRLEQEPSRILPAAAVRLLALRKPPGAAEALLAYVPFAEQDDRSEEVKQSLALLARREGKLDVALLRALADELPQVRTFAAEALMQGGGKEGRAAVRPLLKDREPAVRLRVALALAKAGERRAVPVLIDLLAVANDEQIGQLENILTQLAGEQSPQVSWSSDDAAKKKCRDAWAAWWKVNGDHIDLTRLTVRPWYGYTLLCDSGRHRVFEIDRYGKERWAINEVPYPVDAWVVGGKHVLIAEYNGQRVSERDFQGKLLWSKAVGNWPVNVQRLANGNTFIATTTRLLEVDRAGKEVYTINNVPGGITAAYRARDGRIICLARNGSQCLTLNTNGTVLKQFSSNRNGLWTSGIDLLANGHILITQPNRNKVSEYDRSGNRIVEVDAPQATTATGLPNGHFLIASSNNQCAYEVDRKGKVVWEYKAGTSIFRARRR